MCFQPLLFILLSRSSSIRCKFHLWYKPLQTLIPLNVHMFKCQCQNQLKERTHLLYIHSIEFTDRANAHAQVRVPEPYPRDNEQPIECTCTYVQVPVTNTYASALSSHPISLSPKRRDLPLMELQHRELQHVKRTPIVLQQNGTRVNPTETLRPHHI